MEHRAAGMNGVEAMRAIGFKGRRPDVAASKLMSKPHIREALEARRTDLLEAVGISKEMIARELGRVAFGSPKALYDEDGQLKPIHELDEDAAAQIAGIEVEEIFTGRGEDRQHVGNLRKVKRWDKVKALQELAAIAGIRKTEVAPPAPVGPGLTVIIQQGVQVHGERAAQQHRVLVNLPKPA